MTRPAVPSPVLAIDSECWCGRPADRWWLGLRPPGRLVSYGYCRDHVASPTMAEGLRLSGPVERDEIPAWEVLSS